MVLRDHGTSTTALTDWVTPVNGKLNFESDLFSPYAIICKDTRTPYNVISDVGDSTMDAVRDAANPILAPITNLIELILNNADAKEDDQKNPSKRGHSDNTGDGTEEENGYADLVKQTETEETGESESENSTESNVIPEDDDTDDTSGRGTFVILNLLLTLVSVLLLAVTIFRRKSCKGNLVAALATIILLLVTTGFGRVVFVNWWTIAFAILFILQLGIFYYTNNKKEEVKNEGRL